MDNTDLSTIYTILIVLSACLVGYGCKSVCCSADDVRIEELQDEILQITMRNESRHREIQSRINGFIRSINELTSTTSAEAISAPLPSAPVEVIAECV